MQHGRLKTGSFSLPVSVEKPPPSYSVLTPDVSNLKETAWIFSCLKMTPGVLTGYWMGWISLWCRFSFQAWSGWIITKACSVLKWQQPLQFTLRYADATVFAFPAFTWPVVFQSILWFDVILTDFCDCRTPSWISSSHWCTFWKSILSPSAWKMWSLLSQTWRQS